MGKVYFKRNNNINKFNESYTIKSFTKSLNESMVQPHLVKRVWVNKEADASTNPKNIYFIVLGGDGNYYEVYPHYGDSFKIENKSEKYIRNVADRIKQAYENHNIGCIAYWSDVYNALLVCVNPYNANATYNKEYDNATKRWLEKKGFVYREYDEDYRQYIYDYPSYSDEYDMNDIKQQLDKCKEITKLVAHLQFDYSGTGFFRNLDDIYKNALNA